MPRRFLSLPLPFLSLEARLPEATRLGALLAGGAHGQVKPDALDGRSLEPSLGPHCRSGG
jgi:hypothetical protein